MGDKTGRKETVARPRSKRVQNIKLNLKEMGLGDVNGFDLAG